MTWFSRFIITVLLWWIPVDAIAQQPATEPTEPLLKTAELDQLLAPIALYPDPLLSEVLIASTYPLEVVQAERWVKSNKALKREALTAVLSKEPYAVFDSKDSLASVCLPKGPIAVRPVGRERIYADAVLGNALLPKSSAI